MELPLLQVIVSSCLAAECTSCAEREVMFISFFTSPADFLHSEYVYFLSGSFFTVGPRLRGNELTQTVFWSPLKIPDCGCVCCARQFPCVIPTAAACKHAGRK